MKWTEYVLLCVVSLMIGETAAAQKSVVDSLAQRLLVLETRHETAQVKLIALSHQADELAQKIRARKEKKSLNIIEAGRLNDDLRTSHDAVAEFNATKRAFEKAGAELVQFSEAAIKILNEFAELKLDELAKAQKQRDKFSSENISVQLRAAGELKKRLGALVERVPVSPVIVNVQIAADDSPDIISQKADFLLDQADRLKRSAGQLQKKMDEVQDEIRVRERLAEFVDDLATFDPNTESQAVGEVGASFARESNKSDEMASTTNTRISADNFSSVAAATYFFNYRTLWPEKFDALPQNSLHEWLRFFEKRKAKWLQQADSLQNRSKKIKQLANERGSKNE